MRTTSPSTASAAALALSGSASQGETDISNASRPIKDSEVESCQSIGREPIEFRVGTDALAVVVSQDNDFVDGATLEELALIFSTAETWSDVNPEWPAEPIQRFIPGTDSGTFDFFVEEVFDENEEPILSASNTQLSEDDNVLVQGVLGSPYAIGFFGYAYYDENAGRAEHPVDRGCGADGRDGGQRATTRWPGRCSSTRRPASCRRSHRWPRSSTST